MSQAAPTPSPGAARLAVVGAGAWGTMLAVLLTRNGHKVTLWARRDEHAQALNRQRENAAYLPGLRLPPTLTATADPETAMDGAEAALIAVPSRALREVLRLLPPAPAYLSCSKGLEPGSFKRLSEVIAEVQPQAALAALSGPNLAGEIAAGLPAAATVASDDAGFAGAAQRWLSQTTFRVYTSTDLIGLEVGGAVKNVIALAAGLSDGLGLGDNAKASIITRGLAEIVRLGEHLGGEAQTLYGLAGLGDVVATCSSRRSRNHTAGERIAHGATLSELEAEKLTAEGIPTVRAVFEYAQGADLDLPISKEIYHVVYQNKPPHEAIKDLMGREMKAEW